MSASNTDRLYNLIPAIYRIRDSEIGEPLHALLSVVETEVSVVERDIERLYDNWFIETCEEWAVPYIGDLVGHDPVLPSNGDVNDPHVRDRNRWLFPRREIANIVRYRRRKGTLPVLEDLSRDIAGWPALARETRREVAGMVDLRARAAALVAGDSTTSSDSADSLPVGRRLPDLRRLSSAQFGGALNALPRLADLREPGPGGRGLPHPRRVGLWIWQLPVYSLTGTAPGCRIHEGPQTKLRYFTFHPLGIDTPLYNRPQTSAFDPDDEALPPIDDPLARAHELPLPLLRSLLPPRGRAGLDTRFYGPGKAFLIRLSQAACRACGSLALLASDEGFLPIPPRMIRAADLSDTALDRLADDKDAREALWSSPAGSSPQIVAAVDPQTGRFLLRGLVDPPQCSEKPGATDIRVTFHYAFSGDLGGGEYRRPADPLRRAATWSVSPSGDPVRMSSTCSPLRPFTDEESKQSSLDRGIQILEEHLDRLGKLGPRSTAEQRRVVLELAETGVYRLSKAVDLSVPADVSLEIRAGRETRPVIRCVAQDECEPLPLRFVLAEGARVVLDGVTIATSGISVTQASPPAIPGEPEPLGCGRSLDQRIPDPSRFVLQHATIASSECCGCKTGGGGARRPALGDLVVGRGVGELCVDHSVLGEIRVSCPPPALGGDRTCPPLPGRLTILDSIVAGEIGGDRCDPRVTDLRVERSTLLHGFSVQQIDRISNSLILGDAQIDRRTGQVRYSHFKGTAVMPTLLQCLPGPGAMELSERDFESLTYGAPGFARLRRPRPGEERSVLGLARTGADDGGEMGAFHDQFVPHRERSLERRLDEFTPATHGLVIEYISGAPP